MCADLIIGEEGTLRGETARRHVYRSLRHKTMSEKCRDVTILKFPEEIRNFSVFFRKIQIRREECDYGFNYNPSFGGVEADIGLARRHLQELDNLSEMHRRAFAVWLLIDSKHHNAPELLDVKLPNPPGKAKKSGSNPSQLAGTSAASRLRS